MRKTIQLLVIVMVSCSAAGQRLEVLTNTSLPAKLLFRPNDFLHVRIQCDSITVLRSTVEDIAGKDSIIYYPPAHQRGDAAIETLRVGKFRSTGLYTLDSYTRLYPKDIHFVNYRLATKDDTLRYIYYQMIGRKYIVYFWNLSEKDKISEISQRYLYCYSSQTKFEPSDQSSFLEQSTRSAGGDSSITKLVSYLKFGFDNLVPQQFKLRMDSLEARLGRNLDSGKVFRLSLYMLHNDFVRLMILDSVTNANDANTYGRIVLDSLINIFTDTTLSGIIGADNKRIAMFAPEHVEEMAAITPVLFTIDNTKMFYRKDNGNVEESLLTLDPTNDTKLSQAWIGFRKVNNRNCFILSARLIGSKKKSP